MPEVSKSRRRSVTAVDCWVGEDVSGGEGDSVDIMMSCVGCVKQVSVVVLRLDVNGFNVSWSLILFNLVDGFNVSCLCSILWMGFNVLWSMSLFNLVDGLNFSWSLSFYLCILMWMDLMFKMYLT